jgi:hypothetical protein
VPYYNIDEITNTIFANFINQGDLGLDYFLGNTYILTHYLYAFIFKVFGDYNFTALYLFHSIYVGLTAITLYFCGYELTKSREGGLVAGLGYAVFSICFLSKDFQSVLAESLSLLPVSLACLCLFKSYAKKNLKLVFLTGFFIGISALYKAPSGIMVVAVGVIYLLKKKSWFKNILICGFGLILALSLPVFFYDSISSGFLTWYENISNINRKYIQAYESLSFFYWFSKLTIRTLLVLIASLGLTYFAIQAIKPKKKERASLLVIFLILWFILDWLVVSLGKRVFYHYFVFLLPSLCLLASNGWMKIKPLNKGFKAFIKQKKYLFLSFATLVSLTIFIADGFLRFSLNYKDFPIVVSEIKKLTNKEDRIYVWGLIPQLYFFSERQPASTMIWADSLAGFSTGSPAMEFMRSTGKSLSLPEAILKDLNKTDPTYEVDPINPIGKNNKERFNDLELMDFKELYDYYEVLNHVNSIKWRRVLEDFAINPPKLILDTSPTNIRSFSSYPINNYSLLKKFIEENYTYYGTREGIIFYKLKDNL